jgi:biotin synthase
MGAAWREPKERDMEKLESIISGVKSLGLETCATLGMLSDSQAKRLKEAGLDYYNHNLDTSEEFYPRIITTRTYQDRLDTLARVRESGMKTCCGGIIGMGEQPEDRAELLRTLANLEQHPESVPLNLLVQVEGTPLTGEEAPDALDFVRAIAVARILMPASYVRLSAGREDMSDEMQALCFFAGANSIFYGEKLLTTSNPEADRDKALFSRLGLNIQAKERSRMAYRRPFPYLAALLPDEGRARSAACRGRGRMPPPPGRRQGADRRRGLLVERVPRLQTTVYPF